MPSIIDRRVRANHRENYRFAMRHCSGADRHGNNDVMAETEAPLLVEVSSDAGTARLPARGPLLRIGRSADNDIVLDNLPTVSRHHAELVQTEEGWAVNDLGSQNGTYVNGARVADGFRHQVGSGDVIGVGTATIRLLVAPVGDGLTVEDSSAVDVHRLLTALSQREQEVLALVSAGMTDDQVAKQLFISVKTVHSHLDRIRDKTGLRRRADLTRLAVRLGLSGRAR
jgi:pSer/pThr/pTyr-binding forkhead associated (FHA) protein